MDTKLQIIFVKQTGQDVRLLPARVELSIPMELACNGATTNSRYPESR